MYLWYEPIPRTISFILNTVKYFEEHAWLWVIGNVRTLCQGPVTHDDVVKWKHFPRNWPFVKIDTRIGLGWKQTRLNKSARNFARKNTTGTAKCCWASKKCPDDNIETIIKIVSPIITIHQKHQNTNMAICWQQWWTPCCSRDSEENPNDVILMFSPIVFQCVTMFAGRFSPFFRRFG